MEVPKFKFNWKKTYTDSKTKRVINKCKFSEKICLFHLYIKETGENFIWIVKCTVTKKRVFTIFKDCDYDLENLQNITIKFLKEIEE